MLISRLFSVFYKQTIQSCALFNRALVVMAGEDLVVLEVPQAAHRAAEVVDQAADTTSMDSRSKYSYEVK